MKNKSNFINYQDPSKVVSFCQNSVIKNTGNQSIKIIDISGNKTRYALSGANCVQYNEEETSNTDWIVPILKSKQDDVFWLGASIEFIVLKKSLYKFSEMGLRVYSGKLTTGKNRLFRAEWTMVEGNCLHAQPHWHFFNWNKKGLYTTKNKKSFSSEDEVKEFEPENEKVDQKNIIDKLNDYHFAMSAEWHNNGPCIVNCEGKTQINNWFDHCLEYIIQQLKYISQ